LPLIEEQVDPTVWTDGHIVGQARTAVPVIIHLKDPSWLPYQKQYPLKPEVKERLIPIIKDLKRQGLLIKCSSPYNTPILDVRKGPNKWRLVQDLCLINEAVVLLHPVVPNPYTLLAQIPLGTAYYSVLDLKDAFFCIPLHLKSPPIFAFEDPTRKSGQVTWTVLPQRFRDSPHLFGLALTQDLAEWQCPQATLLQYADDLLLCGPNEPVISPATESLLNFLADRGYKISKEKAQLCQSKGYIFRSCPGERNEVSRRRQNPSNPDISST
jgi:hypothetical protein